MNKNQKTNMNSHDEENLKDQVLNLRNEAEYLRIANQLLWSLLADISKKIQGSSAAIKASVSSLLGYDIIWDASTQHELLEIIDSSTDQVSKYVTLLTLVSKMEANIFTLNTEPIEIPEILSTVNGIISKNYPELSITLSSDASARPACVDFEYLTIALVMFIEIILESRTLEQVNLDVTESKDHWYVDIEEINSDMIDTVSKISALEANELLQGISLLPISKLQLYFVHKIFNLLSIQVSPILEMEQLTGIRLMIPIVK